MERKLVLLSVIVILLTNLSGMVIKIEKVKASGTIYIRADGSIDPSTANITSVDNVTYTFTGSNYDKIVVEKNNIVVDGAGYTLQGTGIGPGIALYGRSNITLRRIEINAFSIGVYFYSSSNNTISGNIITDSDTGVYLYASSNNTVSGNNIIANNFTGVYFYSSSNNTISGNNITDNDWYGVYLHNSCNNNTVSGNSFVDDGLVVFHSFGNMVVDNMVNDKPLVYLEDVSDLMVEDAGQVILVNCNRIRVENLTLSNTSVGVQLWNTNGTAITGNNITGNVEGIFLHSSSNNRVSGNSITENGIGLRFYSSSNNTISGNNIIDSDTGVYLYSSSNNTIYNNNFINIQQVFLSSSPSNKWDNGCEGNFWSDFAGIDSNGDGIGDTPYIIDVDNQDNYPLMNPYRYLPWDVNGDKYVGIDDIVAVAEHFSDSPTSQDWDPKFDINKDDYIGIDDIVAVAEHFGESVTLFISFARGQVSKLN